MKRTLLVLGLLLCAVALAVAGGGKEEAGGAGEAAAGAAMEKSTVEIFWHMAEYENWLRNTMKPIFEEEHPNITLDIKFVNDPENETVLANRLAANDLPEIFAVIGGPAIPALQQDKLLDLSQFPEIKANLDNYPDLYFEFPRRVREREGLDPEGIYGWPTFKVMTGVFYDVNKFAEHGFEPPETYDEFWSLMEEIQQSGAYSKPIAFGNHRWVVYNYFWQVSTALVGPDVSTRLMTGDLKLDDPEMVEVFKWYERLAENDYIDDNYKSREWGQVESDFANLKYGVIPQGPWVFNSYPKMNPDVELDVVPFPTRSGENRHWVGFVGDRNWWVPKESAMDGNQEAQLEVVEWMTGSSYAQHMIRDANLLPVYEQEYDVESPVIEKMLNKGFPTAPQANNQMDLIIPSGNPSFYSYIWDNLTKLTDGEMSAEEFATMVEEYYSQFR